MEDLIATFMPRFKSRATVRLAHDIELARRRDHGSAKEIARDLHAVAGEAGLLGLAHLVPLARAGEEHAKRLCRAFNDADADALLASLTELQSALALVATEPPKGQHE